MLTQDHTIADVTFVMAAWRGALCFMEFAHSKGFTRNQERVENFLRREAASCSDQTERIDYAEQDAAVIARACTQLTEYFAGQRKRFSLPLKLCGSPFQMKVWQALQTIPYGHSISYLQLAHHIDQPLAVRAVAAANAANALPILVPCHRVIGSNGRLTGFGGGLALKQRLLHIEGHELF